MKNDLNSIINPTVIHVINRLPVSILIINKEKELIFTNKTCRKIKLRIKNLNEFIHIFTGPQKFKKMIEEGLKGKIIKEKITITFPEKKYFNLIISPITDDKKHIIGIIVIINEETENVEKTNRIENLLQISIQINKISEILQKEKYKEGIKKCILELRKKLRYGCIHVVELDENEKIKAISFYSRTRQKLKEIISYYNNEYINLVKKKRIFILKDVTKGKYAQHKKVKKKHMAISIAIFKGNEFYGILTIHIRPEIHFYKDEIPLLNELSKLIANAIYRNKLENEAKKRMKEILQYYFEFEKSALSKVFVEYKNKEPVILKTNKAFTDLYGYSNKEVIGKNPRILKSEKTPLFTYKNMWKSILNPKKGHWESQIINKRKDGKLIPVKLIIDTIFENGKAKFFFANHVDMTNEIELLSQLKDSKQYFEKIFQTSKDAIVISDDKLKFEKVNKAFEELTGYKENEIIGKDIHKLLNPGIYDPNSDRIKKFKKTGESELIDKTLEIKIKNKKGDVIPVSLSISKFIYQNQIKVIALIRDIRIKKKMEEEMEKRKQLFESIFDKSSSGIIIYDSLNNGKNFIIKDINEYACKLEGVKKEEVIGKRVDKIFPKIKKIGLYKDFESVYKTGKEKLNIIQYYEDKKRKYWETNNVIKLPSNEIMVIYEDITNQKELEELTRSYTKKLEKEIAKRTIELKKEIKKTNTLSQIKDEFIKNMTHELKTPTSVILGNLELLKKIAPIGKEKEWYVMIEMLQRNATRLSESINQILNLTRITEIKLNYENVVINDLLKSIKEEYLPLADKKGLEIEIEKNIVAIECDKELIRLAISNLLSNAIKFTEKGKISINLKTLDGHVQVIVSDTGIGMSKEVKKHVSEKFYKANPNAPGTGIGLSIVKEIVDKHKGKINLISSIGKGSKFIITLPRKKE